MSRGVVECLSCGRLLERSAVQGGRLTEQYDTTRPPSRSARDSSFEVVPSTRRRIRGA